MNSLTRCKEMPLLFFIFYFCFTNGKPITSLWPCSLGLIYPWIWDLERTFPDSYTTDQLLGRACQLAFGLLTYAWASGQTDGRRTDRQKRCGSDDIQLWTFAYVRLLNKPYENEVTLRGQNMSLKYYQPLKFMFFFEKGFRSFNAESLGSLGQRT